jgi:hypothetical protein
VTGVWDFGAVPVGIACRKRRVGLSPSRQVVPPSRSLNAGPCYKGRAPNPPKALHRMAVVVFVLSLAAMVVLFGSVIALVSWLILKVLRFIVRVLVRS